MGFFGATSRTRCTATSPRASVWPSARLARAIAATAASSSVS